MLVFLSVFVDLFAFLYQALISTLRSALLFCVVIFFCIAFFALPFCVAFLHFIFALFLRISSSIAIFRRLFRVFLALLLACWLMGSVSCDSVLSYMGFLHVFLSKVIAS